MASSSSFKDTENQKFKECILCTGGKWVLNRLGNRKYVKDGRIRTVAFDVPRKNLTLEVLENIVRKQGIPEADKPFTVSYFRAEPGRRKGKKINRYIVTDLSSDHDCECFMESAVKLPVPFIVYHSLKNKVCDQERNEKGKEAMFHVLREAGALEDELFMSKLTLSKESTAGNELLIAKEKEGDDDGDEADTL